MRDGWEKLPTRGTFTRASKGLQPEWYPMDFDEVEAIRRQGYFHEVIGDIQRFSYRDIKSSSQNNTAIMSVDQRGTTTLSPQRRGTRSVIGNHMSRQYKLVDDDYRGSSASRSFYYLSEDGSYTDFNTSADNSKQYKQSSNQYNEYNNSQPNNINTANSTSNISKLFERAVDTEDINNNTTSYDDMRQSKISHQSDEESQLSAYLQWLEAQHIKDDNNDYEDDNQNPKQSFRSFDDMDIPKVPRHPRDQAMITERQ
jgi:hypothetical protein